MKCLIIVVLFSNLTSLTAQENSVTGIIKTSRELEALPEVLIEIEGVSVSTKTDKDGVFVLKTSLEGTYILKIQRAEYQSKVIPVNIGVDLVDLGEILLDRDVHQEKASNLITLAEDDLSDEIDGSVHTILLQATRDVFLSRAAFDFSQAFFKVKRL